jgi:PAS domain S-box-containing protein
MPSFPEYFFERLVRLAPDAVLITRAGRIALANERAEGMFGYRQDELLDRELTILLREQGDPASAAENMSDQSLSARRKDGSTLPVEAARRTIEMEGQRFDVLVVRDITQRREHERHLLRAEQMMAIGQVAAGVAHELRNPLTSIKGLVQVNLREARAHGLPDDDLAVIEHEIRRMERTLQTFLDFARPPKPERRRLDPSTIVQRVFALVAGRAKKQQVALRLMQPDTPVWLEADQDQFQQLLLNLVLNALDAMPHGGSVEVELGRPRGGWVELQVRDSGPGIAAHILPKVFETFVSSKETGVGLGLPLSKRIVEEHGGSLSASNLPAGGACFVLRLPAGNG